MFIYSAETRVNGMVVDSTIHFTTSFKKMKKWIKDNTDLYGNTSMKNINWYFCVMKNKVNVSNGIADELYFFTKDGKFIKDDVQPFSSNEEWIKAISESYGIPITVVK